MKRFLLISLASCLSSALAHRSVDEVVKDLSAAIEKSPTADLLYERGTKYRALKHPAEAKADFERAFALDEEHRPSLIALAEMKGPLALVYAKRVLENSSNPREQLEGWSLMAQVLAASKSEDEAIAICDKIQKDFPDHHFEIDLFHAFLLLEQKKAAQAADLLKKATTRSKAVVLRNSWIDTSLSAQRFDEVLPLIEEELKSSRFRSSWLIRRARAHLRSKPDDARSDLLTALGEIDSRLRPENPDLTLIADRGLIHALLGNRDKAQDDLDLLKKSTLSPRSYFFLSETLRDQD